MCSKGLAIRWHFLGGFGDFLAENVKQIFVHEESF